MTEGIAIIDVWDVETFDSELRGNLDAHIDVIRDYTLTSRRQWLEREASDRTLSRESLWGRVHVGEGAYHVTDGSPHDPRLVPRSG